MDNWLLYGAYGYTGQLIIEEALKRGHRPVLSGRNEAKLRPLADQYNLDFIAIGLDDQAALTNVVREFELVFHAAGPFVHTSDPMIKACLAGKTHYVDITGEIPVFENTFAYHALAEGAGVVLISGVGFDIVPTDCLAAYVAQQLDEPQELELAFATKGGVSGGTTNSMLEIIPKVGIVVRRNGRLVSQRFGQGAKNVLFSDGKLRHVVPIPWGDLSSSVKSTGIPNVTTYIAYPKLPGMSLGMPVAQALLSVKPLRRVVQTAVNRFVGGPSEEVRERGKTLVWAKAADAEGNTAEAWLESLEGYTFTAVAGVRAVERILDASRPLTGALTPSLAFGPDFVLEIEGTTRYDAL